MAIAALAASPVSNFSNSGLDFIPCIMSFKNDILFRP
ncbi:hypothetical protein [Avibacterium volantium]